VLDAIGDRTDLIQVAQSMGGFTAPLVCERVPVNLRVMLAAMVPAPGESPGDWWTNTGCIQAKRELDERRQSETPFAKPWPLDAWPEVPTEFLLCRDDRFFPAEFQRRIVKERLGIVADEMDSGHLPALAHPKELVERLEAYRSRYDES
jgi:pimeloyl-ACP methyl ester carboxylesterase